MKVHLPASLVASGRYHGTDKGNTTDRGYGWAHQKKVKELLKNSPNCHWCHKAKATEGDHHRNGLVPSCSKCNNKRSHEQQKLKSHKGPKVFWASAYEFACHSAACAPPPAGVGGSRAGGSKVKVAAPVITAAEARGDSRPVSHGEFQRLAIIGRRQLDKFVSQSSPITGLEQNWSSVKKEAFDEVKKSWGGATFDAHTGRALPQGADAYAITVKHGHETVSVPENASRAEFDKAMETAKTQFRSILEQGSHHLGVFHDDENHRIDIDPVLVVKSRSEVDTIGAASRSIGGAYHFKDGNGYWPPHVAEEKKAA